MNKRHARKVYLQKYYRRHRERIIARQRVRRSELGHELQARKRECYRARHRRITADELEVLRQDPRQARCEKKTTILTTLIGPDDIVCLECGVILQTLNSHLATEHALTAAQYREKWGYNRKSALTSVSLSKKHSTIKKRSRFIPPVETRFGQTRGPSWKAGVLARQKWYSLERRLNQRERIQGKALPERWKQMPDGRVATDVVITYQRLLGQEFKQIGRQVGLTVSTVSARLRRIGFPRAKAPCVFGHGGPITSQHLIATCEDFNLTQSRLAELMGIWPPNLSHRLNTSPANRPLSKRWANRLLSVNKLLKADYSKAATSKGGRPRILTPSERREIPAKYHVLRRDLWVLRSWINQQDGNLAIGKVWEWACDQSRRRTSQSLLFWPQFHRWITKSYDDRAFLSGQWVPNELALQFLADDYGASFETLRRIIRTS